MTGFLGNGATAPQTYWVLVGQVTVAGGVTTNITWYELQGRYDSGFTATLPGAGTNTVINHNLGVVPNQHPDFVVQCTTNDNGWVVGDTLVGIGTNPATGSAIGMTATQAKVQSGSGVTGWTSLINAAGGAFNLTAASWKYKLIAQRGW